MASKYQYKNNIYISPDGKVYQRSGISSGLLPVFGHNTGGNTLYKYNGDQIEIPFLVDENGYLISEFEGLTIDNSGNISGEDEWTLIEDNVSEQMQRNLDLLRSHNKRINIKATLLNEFYQEVEVITGKIKTISFEKSYDSDIRSTCSITLSIPRKEQIDLDFENTWDNRMVHLEIGLYSVNDSDYIWYNLGNMLMASGNTVYNATTQEVKLNLVDLMAMMTQERGSQIGTPVIVRAESVTKNVLAAIVTTFSPFKRYEIADFPDTIPYDLENEIGAYPIDLLHSIIDLFPTYEMFYDVDGKFIVQEIPTKIGDPIDIGANIIDDLIISENRTMDYSQIKNTTEIWGRELTADYTATNCVTDDDCYKVTIDNTFTTLVSNDTFAILPTTNNIAGQTMKIQDTTECGIYTVSGDGLTYTAITAGRMKAGTPYVLKYFENKFVLQGEMQVRVIVQEVVEEPSQEAKEAFMEDNNCTNVQWIINPDSPFACTISPTTGLIRGEIKQVFEGGEYEGIYTTELAYERAKYENWKACRLQDTKEVEVILIPWMEISNKIQFTSPVTEQLETWIVQSISYDFTKWTMTVGVSRFYPYYPW